MNETINSKNRSLDPEPMAIATLCVATIAMAGGVSTAIINYKKYIRDGNERREDAAADFLARADRLQVTGERLRYVIGLVREIGANAFQLIHVYSHVEVEAEDQGTKPLTLRAGETSIYLGEKDIAQWRDLVTNVAQNVERMNVACEAYEEAFSELLGSGRRLQQILKIGDDLDSIISQAIDASVRFRRALDSYQNIRAGDSIEKAEQRFQQVATAAESMVLAGNGFAMLVRIILMNQSQG